MQNKITLIRNIIASGLLFFALAPQNHLVADAEEQSTFLLRLNCVDTGVGNWAGRIEDVAVDKAVYTSRLFMGPGDSQASLTCRLQPNEEEVIFQNLQLGFGMRDNDQSSPAVQVNIYLDQVQAKSLRLSPGQAELLSLDVASTNNVSIEAVCLDKFKRYCDRVYFWDASLTIAPE